MSHKISRISGTTPISKNIPTTLVKHKGFTYPPIRFAKLSSLWIKPKNSSRPRRFEHGLFGNAHIFKGFTVSFSDKRTRRFWKPNAIKLRLYSETLDKRIRIRSTAAVLRTIDRMGGLDNYLLKTPPQALHSKFGRILREIIMEMRDLKKKESEYLKKVDDIARELAGKNFDLSIEKNLHLRLERMARGFENLPPEQKVLYEECMSVYRRKQEIMNHVNSVYANYLGRKEEPWRKIPTYIASNAISPENVPNHFPIAQQFKQDNQDFFMKELLEKYTTKKESP